MTVKEWIIKGTISALEERRQKLIDMGAPSILIEKTGEELINLYNGVFACKGEVELLEEEMIDVEQKKGRGGIPYYTFNGNINYFPRAKYGRFVAKGEVK